MFLRSAEAYRWAAHRQAAHRSALHRWVAHRWATYRWEEQAECRSVSEEQHPALEEWHLLEVFPDCMAATEAYFLEVSEVPACLSVLELEVSVVHPEV